MFSVSVVKMERNVFNSDLLLGSQEIISKGDSETAREPAPMSSTPPRISIADDIDDDDENSIFVSYNCSADHSYCK